MLDSGTNAIAEYPNNEVIEFAINNVLQDIATKNIAKNSSSIRMMKFTKSSNHFDGGHRHFSPLHFVYPALFNFFGNNSNEVHQAAIQFMSNKALNAGGHTSWSAAWESCLYARLYQPESALNSLFRILRKYSFSNLLSMHPNLEHKMGPGMEHCGTCFEESGLSKMRDSGVIAHGLLDERGFVSETGDKVIFLNYLLAFIS
jgi:hypothetical protein